MLRQGGQHVNVLKKIRTNGVWKLCPVVREANGRLRDRVRVDGHVETHSEGVYYIEWREDGRRRRMAVPNQAEVLERARLKSLELEAHKAGARLDSSPNPLLPAIPTPAAQPTSFSATPSGSAAQLLFAGIEACLKEIVTAMVNSHLGSLGLGTTQGSAVIPPIPSSPISTEDEGPPFRPFCPQAEDSSPMPSKSEITIADAVELYLKDVEPPQREPKTYEEYRNVLYRFRDTCKKMKVKEIDRSDCLEFIRHLYSIGNEARTVYNRIGIVQQWLKLHGIKGLLQRGDKPKFVSNMRKMYQPEELESLLRACDPDEKMRYLFFLLTGERDKEVRYTAWSDIDFNRSCVRVTAKKQLRFKPKDKEERELPVPTSLLTALKEYKARQIGVNRHDLVFPTSTGRPDRKFENKLKRIAYRAGLNCGHCVSKYGNKCGEGPYCGNWFLHKFRHTFATACLEDGVSIRTLQEWLVHSDLNSTMVYLKYVGRKGVHELLDKGAMAELAANSLRSAVVSTSALPN
jgi:integrase/recombinase XerD